MHGDTLAPIPSPGTNVLGLLVFRGHRPCMEPVNLDKSEPVNVGPVRSGRPARAAKPKRQQRQPIWGGPPDLIIVIATIAVMVLLMVAGSFAVSALIGGARNICHQSVQDAGNCANSGPSRDIDPIFIP